MNDFIRLVAERACEQYEATGNMFNVVCFSDQFMKLSKTPQQLDNATVRAMLTGRDDIEIVNRFHFKVIGSRSVEFQCDR